MSIKVNRIISVVCLLLFAKLNLFCSGNLAVPSEDNSAQIQTDLNAPKLAQVIRIPRRGSDYTSSAVINSWLSGFKKFSDRKIALIVIITARLTEIQADKNEKAYLHTLEVLGDMNIIDLELYVKNFDLEKYYIPQPYIDAIKKRQRDLKNIFHFDVELDPLHKSFLKYSDSLLSKCKKNGIPVIKYSSATEIEKLDEYLRYKILIKGHRLTDQTIPVSQLKRNRLINLFKNLWSSN